MDWRRAWRDKAKRNTQRRKTSAPQGTHTFTVQKPYCTPARDIIYTALHSYGVRIERYSEGISIISLADAAKLMKIELRQMENLRYGPAAITFLPMSIQAKVTVPARQAGWAEYLMERTGRLAVTGGKVDRRNRGWADQHGGKMPAPWGRPLQPPGKGEAWIEAGCAKGHAAWQAAQKAVRR